MPAKSFHQGESFSFTKTSNTGKVYNQNWLHHEMKSFFKNGQYCFMVWELIFKVKICIYIYIYIYRERERERVGVSQYI